MASLTPAVFDNQSVPESYYTDGQRYARVVLLPFLLIIGVIGNLFVIIAIFTTPKLQKIVNYFIVSLALSDLLVCTIVLPLAIHQEFNDMIWGLERWVCYLWVALDVFLCTASIWNLCLVSTDRYLAICRPMQYVKYRTPRTAVVLITGVWIMAAITAITLSIGASDSELETCVVNSNPAVTVIGPMIAFYIPCIFMLFLYWRIYLTVNEYVKRRRPSNMSNASFNTDDNSTSDVSSKQHNVIVPSITLAVANSSNNLQSKDRKTSATRQDSKENGRFKSQVSGGSTRRRSLFRTNSIVGSITKEKKSAIVLAIVVATFIGCWLPFFIVYLLTLCSCAGDIALPQAFNATTWLGWCNSLINPVIYTIFNADFRKAFEKIVLCRSKRQTYRSDVNKTESLL